MNKQALQNEIADAANTLVDNVDDMGFIRENLAWLVDQVIAYQLAILNEGKIGHERVTRDLLIGQLKRDLYAIDAERG